MHDRASVLIIHDQAEVADLLRGLLEANDLEPRIGASVDDALAQLVTADVAVAPWDRALGQAVYRRVLAERRDLRFRFVFVADEIPERLTEAARRLRIVRLDDLARLVEAAHTRARRRSRPRLLVIEDEPYQLEAMAQLLGDEGFDVVTAAGANDAMPKIERERFDVILCDWLMSAGSGADLHAWLVREHAERAHRLVFLTAGSVVEVRARAIGATVMPKGQDLSNLVAVLRGIATSPLANGTPPRGARSFR